MSPDRPIAGIQRPHHAPQRVPGGVAARSEAMPDSRRYPRRLLVQVTTGVLICVHIVLLLNAMGEQPGGGPRPHSFAQLYHDVAFTRGPAADFFALYHAGVNARRGVSVFEARENPPVTPYYYPYRYLPFTAITIGRLAATLPPATAWKA